MRRRLDADWFRDQYHKQKPLQVAFSAVHRISCCNPPPSQVSVSRCVPCQDSFQNLSQNRVPESSFTVWYRTTVLGAKILNSARERKKRVPCQDSFRFCVPESRGKIDAKTILPWGVSPTASGLTGFRLLAQSANKPQRSGSPTSICNHLSLVVTDFAS